MRGTRGVVVVVSLMICATVSSGIESLRARPARIFSRPANPSTPNRERHARTVPAVTPTSSTIAALATPSAAITNTRARGTCRCGTNCAAPTAPRCRGQRAIPAALERAGFRWHGRRRVTTARSTAVVASSVLMWSWTAYPNARRESSSRDPPAQ